jgi:protein-S-isoprenylcysteine O-methyltransferase Ste14
VAGLDEQVAQAASLLGLLLALDTLFTSEQARRITEERTRIGGAKRSALRTTLVTCVLLGGVTLAALASLTPLAIDVVATIGDPSWEPVFGVFLLTYVLLVGLLAWQILLTSRARPQ